MFGWKKYLALVAISICLPPLITNIAHAKKVNDYITVVCIKPAGGGTFFGGASSELHACDQLYCHKGKTKKYKNHKFCEGGKYSEGNHVKFGNIKQKIICVSAMPVDDPEGLCNSNLE